MWGTGFFYQNEPLLLPHRLHLMSFLRTSWVETGEQHQLSDKKLHPAIFTRCSNKTGDYFFTFWQKFIRIVATCSRVALPCGSR